MNARGRRRCAAALLLAGLLATTPSPAQTATPENPHAAEARGLFEQGVGLAQLERWGEALEFFRRSRALVERPSTVFNIGNALVRLGRPTEAVRALEEFLRIADPVRDASRRESATQMLETARPVIATLALSVQPASAELRVDGELANLESSRELRIDPGRHTLEVTAPGHRPERVVLSVLPGSWTEQVIELRAEETAPARIAVSTAVAGARVHVDGREVGRGGYEGAVDPGRHEIAVEAAGFRTLRRVVELAPGGSFAIQADLEREARRSVLSSPWFWTVAGVLVAGGVVAAGLALGGTEDPYRGTTGVVLQALTHRF